MERISKVFGLLNFAGDDQFLLRTGQCHIQQSQLLLGIPALGLFDDVLLLEVVKDFSMPGILELQSRHTITPVLRSMLHHRHGLVNGLPEKCSRSVHENDDWPLQSLGSMDRRDMHRVLRRHGGRFLVRLIVLAPRVHGIEERPGATLPCAFERFRLYSELGQIRLALDTSRQGPHVVIQPCDGVDMPQRLIEGMIGGKTSDAVKKVEEFFDVPFQLIGRMTVQRILFGRMRHAPHNAEIAGLPVKQPQFGKLLIRKTKRFHDPDQRNVPMRIGDRFQPIQRHQHFRLLVIIAHALHVHGDSRPLQAVMQIAEQCGAPGQYRDIPRPVLWIRSLAQALDTADDHVDLKFVVRSARSFIWLREQVDGISGSVSAFIAVLRLSGNLPQEEFDSIRIEFTVGILTGFKHQLLFEIVDTARFFREEMSEHGVDEHEDFRHRTMIVPQSRLVIGTVFHHVLGDVKKILRRSVTEPVDALLDISDHGQFARL